MLYNVYLWEASVFRASNPYPEPSISEGMSCSGGVVSVRLQWTQGWS